MAKKHNREDSEDRSFGYREWRWNAGFGEVQDLDQVEYATIGNEKIPLAVIELTLREVLPSGPKDPPDSYFDAVKRRYLTESQGEFTKQISKRLNVDAYIVVHNRELTRFWIYNMNKGVGFSRVDSSGKAVKEGGKRVERNLDGYKKWLIGVRKKKTEEYMEKVSVARSSNG